MCVVLNNQVNSDPTSPKLKETRERQRNAARHERLKTAKDA